LVGPLRFSFPTFPQTDSGRFSLFFTMTILVYNTAFPVQKGGPVHLLPRFIFFFDKGASIFFPRWDLPESQSFPILNCKHEPDSSVFHGNPLLRSSGRLFATIPWPTYQSPLLIVVSLILPHPPFSLRRQLLVL